MNLTSCKHNIKTYCNESHQKNQQALEEARGNCHLMVSVTKYHTDKARKGRGQEQRKSISCVETHFWKFILLQKSQFTTVYNIYLKFTSFRTILLKEERQQTTPKRTSFVEVITWLHTLLQCGI